MAAAQPTTMVEALQRVITDLASAMVTPDADVQFLSQLQGIVVGRMRQGSGQQGGQMQHQPPPQGGAPGGGMGGPPQGPPPGADGGMGVGAPGGGGPPPGMGGPPPIQRPTPNGVTPLAQAPNPDELRRMLAGKAGA